MGKKRKYKEALERIAWYPDGLRTSFEWQALAEKMQNIACHALGFREGERPLPDLPHKERKEQ